MTITYHYLDEVDSTNNELKRRVLTESLPEATVISAGMQTAGRGRSGHDWVSPPGVSVSTSMILYPTEVSCEHISRLTPIAAVAVAETVEELYGLKTQIKWPNDVLLSEKKICGILTEMSAKDNRVEYVVVGIGVNVHQTSFPPEIEQMATSLDIELAAEQRGSQQTHCEEITRRIWTNFTRHYEEFLKSEDLSLVRDFYNARLVNRDRRVKVMDPAGAYEGTAKGIDFAGRLLVDEEGRERKIDSGEVSVRGIYGYV